MKKKIIPILIIFILFLSSLAFPGATTTDRLSTNGLIYTGNCVLYGYYILTDGTNNATLTIYDSANFAGKIVRQMTVIGTNFYGGESFGSLGRTCNLGISCTISSAGTAYYWIGYGQQ